MPSADQVPVKNPHSDDAMAQVGCPNRRIDRLCITCCSSSQPSYHAGCPARSRLPRKRDGFLVTLTSGHHGPGPPCNVVGKRDGGDLGRLSRQQRRELRPMAGVMDLGVADDGECSGHEQAAQIAITLFADAAEPLVAPLECCFGTSPIQQKSYVPIGRCSGQQHWRPERSPASDLPQGYSEGVCSSGWTDAKPGSSDRTPESAA
jgi:hypothetical protein